MPAQRLTAAHAAVLKLEVHALPAAAAAKHGLENVEGVAMLQQTQTGEKKAVAV